MVCYHRHPGGVTFVTSLGRKIGIASFEVSDRNELASGMVIRIRCCFGGLSSLLRCSRMLTLASSHGLQRGWMMVPYLQEKEGHSSPLDHAFPGKLI